MKISEMTQSISEMRELVDIEKDVEMYLRGN